MIALDTNILVYAHRADSPFHEPARTVVRELAGGSASFALPLPVIHEYLRVVTGSKFTVPTPPDVACEQMDRLVRRRAAVTIAETRDHLPRLYALIEVAKISGPLVYDARIAAICLAHGVRELWTADRDFGRFPALRTRNPLVGQAAGEESSP